MLATEELVVYGTVGIEVMGAVGMCCLGGAGGVCRFCRVVRLPGVCGLAGVVCLQGVCGLIGSESVQGLVSSESVQSLTGSAGIVVVATRGDAAGAHGALAFGFLYYFNVNHSRPLLKLVRHSRR